jgi:hypothetical protein
MSHPARFRLTIPAAGTDTPALSSLLSKGNLRSTLGNTSDLIIYAPAALTGTITIQIAPRYGAGEWKTFQDAGADVNIAAGKAISIPVGAIEDLRIHSSGAEGAARDFDVVVQISLGQ